MSSHTKKRPRNAAVAQGIGSGIAVPVEPPALSLRAALLARLETTPTYITDVGARFCVTGADPCVCSLGREIADRLRIVQESAEAERQRLESVRATLHAAIDARIDELLAKVSAAESAKASALERELERIDEALERLRREHAAAREAALGEGDADDLTSALAAELSARLDSVDALLATLPHGPVEPSLLRVELDVGAAVVALRTAGTMLAPCGVRADDVVVRRLPTSVCPGRTLRFELAVSDDYPRRAPAELEVAAASLAFHARLTVSLVCGAESPQPLQATLAPATAGSVAVTVAIPEGTCIDAEVVVSGVTLAGQAVTGGQALPGRLRVIAGIQAPLRLEGAVAAYSSSAPFITPDGTLYAPKHGSPDVLVFAADGTPLPPLPLAALGLSTSTASAAFVEATGMLLLADANGIASKLVAVDAASRAVRWSAALGGGCYSIAVLPAQSVVVVGDFGTRELHTLHLSDGTRMASANADWPTFVVADPALATVYVSTLYQVSAFRWDGAALVAEGVVEAAGATRNDRPLAVVPPAPGQRTSYLVVGTGLSSTLRVLSLPDRRLVHTHELKGMGVLGLAGDPSGTTLVVCNAASKAFTSCRGRCLACHPLPLPLCMRPNCATNNPQVLCQRAPDLQA